MNKLYTKSTCADKSHNYKLNHAKSHKLHIIVGLMDRTIRTISLESAECRMESLIKVEILLLINHYSLKLIQRKKNEFMNFVLI